VHHHQPVWLLDCTPLIGFLWSFTGPPAGHPSSVFIEIEHCCRLNLKSSLFPGGSAQHNTTSFTDSARLSVACLASSAQRLGLLAPVWFCFSLGSVLLSELKIKEGYCSCLLFTVLGDSPLLSYIATQRTARRFPSFALAVVMGSSSTSSGPIPVLRCPMLFKVTKYHDWVPHICLHKRDLRLWDFLMSELLYPPPPSAPA
jgi:hypothetical protein